MVIKMNKKIKVLIGLLLVTATLTSCTHSNLGGELKWFTNVGSEVVASAEEQSAILEYIKTLKLSEEDPNSDVLSINFQLQALLATTNVLGYGYYDYDPNDDTSTFKFESNTQTKLNIDLSADQKLNSKLNFLGFDLINIKDQQLNFDAKPLHELVNLSFIANIDPTMIVEYRKSVYDRAYLDALEKSFYFYVLVLDAAYLNKLINNNMFVFQGNVTLGIFIDQYNDKLSIITLEAAGKFSNVLDVKLTGFIYNTR